MHEQVDRGDVMKHNEGERSEIYSSRSSGTYVLYMASHFRSLPCSQYSHSPVLPPARVDDNQPTSLSRGYTAALRKNLCLIFATTEPCDGCQKRRIDSP
ncbi:hypothetical protein BDZ97DRAFT_1810721 [Flammula alnicola]|nr:hypothetical protein BDZ97DRAFT_1810721 [Flammula alnicola]